MSSRTTARHTTTRILGACLLAMILVPTALAEVITFQFEPPQRRLTITEASDPLASAGVTFEVNTIVVGADIVETVWDFGDGTVPVLVEGDDPTPPPHYYPAATGTYDVTALVRESDGSNTLFTRVGLIQVFGDAEQFVTFVSDTHYTANGVVTFTAIARNFPTPPVTALWDFGDGTTMAAPFENPVVHTYVAAGTYDVRLSVAEDASQFAFFREFITKITVAENGVTVSGEPLIQDGNGELDNASLMPNQDWHPLFFFNFTLDADTDDFLIIDTSRCLNRLLYSVDTEAIPRIIDPIRTDDFYEWGLFLDEEVDDEGPLLNSADSLLLTWDNEGAPYGIVRTDLLAVGDLVYDLDFAAAGVNDIFRSENQGGQNYIVAFRTSSVFRSGSAVSLDPAFGVQVGPTTFVDCATGGIVLDENGEPLDTFPEDPIGFETDLGYTSSFTVWDHTGEEDPRYALGNRQEREGGINLWEHPRVVFTPLPEHTRERYDLTGNFFDLVTGEFIFIREVVATETWFPLIDLNLHTAPAPYIAGVSEVPNGYRSDGNLNSAPISTIYSGLREVNIVLTDIGADPFGPPGNGGFDPRTMLDPMSGFYLDDDNPNSILGRDFSKNGLWVFHDTNNNTEFDPPDTTFNQGAVMNDLAMVPDLSGLNGSVQDFFEPGWEYIPFPPGGGDPWWKIKIPLLGDDVRFNNEARIEAVPDGTSDEDYGDPEFTPDYFIVMRTDSGYQDVGGLAGDGTGIRPGADFRAFVEPRRFNSALGSWDGGIYVDSMQMFGGIALTSVNVLEPWQDDVRWDFPNINEPYFPERTMNPTIAKPIRAGFEVYDLGITYESNNEFAGQPDTVYGGSGVGIGTGASNADSRTVWDQWLDPFAITQSQFHDFHSVGNINGSFPGGFALDGFVVLDDDYGQLHNYSYETTPFFNPTFDTVPIGPRSSFWAPPNMLNQPNLPTYDTWLPFQAAPSQLEVGEYPRELNWEPQNRAARKLVQRVEAVSGPQPLLGLNLVGTNDPITNRLAPTFLEEFTVAFFGDDFSPSDLFPLDPNGQEATSGVLLLEDSAPDGVTFATLLGDASVPLSDLRWADAPEPVDLDGDRVADDLDGDGDVDGADVAWVLNIRPTKRWRLPTDDYRLGGGFNTILGDDPQEEPDPEEETDEDDGDGGNKIATTKVDAPDYWTKSPRTINRTLAQEKADANKVAHAKAVQNKELPAGGKAGIDLWLYVQTSPLVKRFEHFRAFIPETLPSRPTNLQDAGIRFFPRVDRAPKALFNRDPDENPVQDWYDHEGFIVNVPTALSKLTSANQTITADSGPTAVLALDASTNRGFEAIIDDWFAKGQGIGGASSFQVPSAGWAIDALSGYFLIDSNYEQFEITGNSDDTLALVSGTPANGEWQVIKDPTFLEYLVVEFYDNGNDGDFDFARDMKPFNFDPRISGVALYRDNDFDPSNRNGIFDPLIDIPVQTDFAPFFIGVPGEPAMQVKLVFASPGTDDAPQAGLPRGIENQPRRRQVIPDFSGLEFNPLLDPIGAAVTEQYQGPEFFVVIRTSENLEPGDDFRVAISSWGPPTPSGPDPDTFPPPPLAPQDEFDKFQEFPWGSQAVGYVTMFRDSPDLTGFKFLRTTIARDRVTDVITGSTASSEGDGLIISGVVPQILPPVIGPEDRELTIFGTNFGPNPVVTIEGVQVFVVSSTDTQIEVLLPEGLVLTSPVTLTVTNTLTGESATRLDLFAVGDVDSPRLLSVDPPRGDSSVFPVTLTGRNFNAAEVFFDDVKMIVEPGGTDTMLRVSMPNGGLPTPGGYDVTVRATVVADGDEVVVSSTLADGFIFENPIGGGGGGAVDPLSLPVPCFIATAAYGTSSASELEALRGVRDNWLMQSAVGRTAIDGYYNVSPAIADVIAQQPWLAAWVRAVLALGQAWSVMAAILVGAGAATVIRRRSARAQS